MAFRHSRAGADRAGRAQSAARTARPGPSRPRRRSPTGPRPAASHGPPQRPGRPCGPRCGPRSVTGPTGRCGRPAQAQRRAERGRRGGEPTGRRCRPARPRPQPGRGFLSRVRSGAARPRARPAARPIPPARSGARRPPWLSSSGVESTRQPPDLCRAPGGRDLAAEGGHRRRVDRREPQRQCPGDVAQLEPRQRARRTGRTRGGRRSARRRRGPGRRTGPRARREPRPEPGPRPRERAFMVVLDSTIVNIAARAAGSRSSASIRPVPEPGSIDRHRARLARRLSGQRPGMPGRVGAAAVARDPDVRSTGDRGRDRMPSGLRERSRERPSGCGGFRCSVHAACRTRAMLNLDRATCYCGHGCWLSVRTRAFGWQPAARDSDERMFSCRGGPPSGGLRHVWGYRAPIYLRPITDSIVGQAVNAGWRAGVSEPRGIGGRARLAR